MEKTPDRKTLEQVVESYNALAALQARQKFMTARMIRACMARLKAADQKSRREGFAGLKSLAELLEGESKSLDDETIPKP